VLRANTDGSSVRLRDVARVEIGGQAYAPFARLNGKPAVGIGHAAFAHRQCHGHRHRGAKAHGRAVAYFPESVKFRMPYDTSKFVRLSIIQVVVKRWWRPSAWCSW
jgi:multidrug efflux pump